MEYTGSLHNHTDYSNIRLRDCIIKLEDGISYAEKLGHKVIAITDHEFTGSWIKAQKIAKKHPDIKVILGNEIYLCRNGLNSSNYNREFDKYYHFILLAKDRIGARQIMEISTRAWRRSYMARGMRRVPTYYQDLFDIIGAEPGHVIGSTACLGGALPTQLLKYRSTENGQLKEKIGIWIDQMDNLFGHGNFFLEMQPNNDKDQIYVNQRLLDISNATGIPYIITTDSHYLRKEDRVIHKAYLNAQNGDREVDTFYATTYMMNTEELESYFKYLSREQLDIAYNNIENIMNMCEEYSLEKPLRIPNLKWHSFLSYKDEYPKWFELIPALEKFYKSQYPADRQLVAAIISGIKSHPDVQNEEAYKEINLCLEDTWVSSEVNKTQWSAYYLNLQNIIDVCWEADSIVGPGRGSGVGFILLYILDITQINPLREKTKTFRWRFLNPERVSVLDVDFDIEGSKRAQVFNKFREVYGEDYVANVATFKTEKSKSAILTAARGLGIDVDIAQYIASLIPADRGMIRSLDQCMYGDIENNWKPIKQFVFEMENNYPELWNVAHNIEGLICSSGIHAGGVIFVDEPFTESTALMRAPDGTICTQFELHDAEAVSLIKYDALSVEAMDKIHNCINLICDYGYAERKPTLKETYENLIGIYKINRDDPKMWKMVWNHDIQSLFQMEKQSGIQGIATLKPTSVDDLAILNSTIRLMAQERGGEMPTNKLARFKRNPKEWLKEMNKYGLDEEKQKILAPVLSMSYGLCIAQEQFMELVQLPELGGFSLTWADKLRKSIAKKNPKDYEALTNEFYKITEEKGIDQKFAHYVWDVLIAMSKGYGFNQSHTLAYSLIALQEMNLACYYPIVFWNCACLINDAGGEEDEETTSLTDDEESEISWTNEIEDFNLDEEDDEDDDEDDEDELKEEKKKKKAKKVNYGKIASAIGKMKMENITVTPPDINYSSFTFSPDPKKNLIRYGLSGITGLGDDAIKDIIANRPYSSLNDLISKVKLKKPQIINLIKAGAFDEFGDRYELMYEYISLISDAKKRITLQNMQMMINYNMIPSDFEFQVKVFNYNKYLKKFKTEDKKYYLLDAIAMDFYENNFDIDRLFPTENSESGFMISVDRWDYMYQKQMDIIRPWIKNNADKLLKELNDNLMQTVWNKYCNGSFAKWEMDSTSCYFGEHELDDLNYAYYDFEDFFCLPDTPDIDNVITIKGKTIPIFRLSRIVGTVLDRNKNKKLVTLLTKTGVVTVKIYGDAFTHYDKQISQRGADGKKHVIEKSWFTRGNKIIITGIKQEDGFLAKKYSRTPYHLVELITKINNDGTIETRGERAEVEE